MPDSKAKQIINAVVTQIRTLSDVHDDQVSDTRVFYDSIPQDMFPFMEVFHGGEARVSEPGHLRAVLAVLIKITFKNVQEQNDAYVENFLQSVENVLALTPTLGLNSFVHQSFISNISADEAQDDTRQERTMTLSTDLSFVFGDS